MKAKRKIRLPDHSYSVSASHKLIPSVNLICDIDDNMFGDYSAVKSTGTVYVAVRSNYHSKTSPSTHQNDLLYMFNDAELGKSLKSSDGLMKPVYLQHNDGGTDLQIRNEKTIKRYLTLFQEYKLDYLCVSQSAPDMSFINKAERFMAFLSFKLSGLVLDHQHYGNHLDKNKKVVDEDLCKKNLYRAGAVLSDKVWNNMEIGGKIVSAHFVSAEDDDEHKSNFKLDKDDFIFLNNHAVFGRHSLQIAKCFDAECCEKPRSQVFKMLKSRFIPPPYVLRRHSTAGLVLYCIV